ncbi:universal stress protein [Halorubellus sp. JP-L1]|uniref:universal stress protein n=1 Tax=Halorubellus sp. JP-L1 TaxID=2715753 RepID=UPI00140AD64A|nr:universal stress protein [Halorubellus sp. JP-L1]NHN41243.1 universal stress protein [Halorubellus sp. JP-L1]
MVDLLSRPLVPVASEADAEATLSALLPRLDAGTSIVVCHVVEKAGGGIDKASVEQREERAEEIFDVVRARCRAADVDVDTRIDYGTDVAETVFDAAADVDASAVVFTPREGSRWLQFLTGETTLDLVTESDRPVVVLPDDDRTVDDAASGARND